MVLLSFINRATLTYCILYCVVLCSLALCLISRLVVAVVVVDLLLNVSLAGQLAGFPGPGPGCSIVTASIISPSGGIICSPLKKRGLTDKRKKWETAKVLLIPLSMKG